MHFLISIPGAENKTAQALMEVGLGDFAPNVEIMPSEGPDEKRGLLCAWRRPGKNDRFHFNAGEQTWIPSLPNGPDGQGRGRYWVGFWNDSPVTPEDLQRPDAHPGSMVELGDGQMWRIPEINRLPQDFLHTDDGSWKFEIQPKYQEIWDEASEWRAKVLGPDGSSVPITDVLDFCERVLGQNYRLVPEVVSHLRLFNSTNVAKVLHTSLSLISE